MALKDKIITYNMQIVFMDGRKPVSAIEYNNISRVAVNYYEEWYSTHYNIELYLEENKVK